MEITEPVLGRRFEDAFLYAAKLHARQVRKGSGVPYIAHLIGVASIALEYGADEDEAIAALLHDAIEDQGGTKTRQGILDRFGKRVADIVEGCTDADTQPKPPWKERKEAYIAHIKDALPSVHLVSCSDKLHNARTILKDFRVHGEALWERFKGGKDGTLWYYRALSDSFRAVYPTPLSEELERVVAELERLVSEAAGK
ncbi:MAG: HD domain-containing protein [Syntrophorhabdus sp.]